MKCVVVPIGLEKDELLYNFLSRFVFFFRSKKSSHFETDYENRLGFSKYLDGLSDSMWQQAVSLIKYAGKRGSGVAPIDSSSGLSINNVIFKRNERNTKIFSCFLTLFMSIIFTRTAERWYQTLDRSGSPGVGPRPSPNAGP